jgi:hypothetical protein
LIYNNFGLVAPDIVEQVRHDKDGFIPYQFIISLAIVFRIQLGNERSSGRTSENAGATIFLNFFHSSPSETTTFGPKNANGA